MVVIISEAKNIKMYNVSMAFLTLSICFAPKYCEIITVEPIAMPTTKDISANINGKLAPTAARASLPKTRPITMLSTTLYNCWNTFPMSMGSANLKISFPSFPSVKSFKR